MNKSGLFIGSSRISHKKCLQRHLHQNKHNQFHGKPSFCAFPVADAIAAVKLAKQVIRALPPPDNSKPIADHRLYFNGK